MKKKVRQTRKRQSLQRCAKSQGKIGLEAESQEGTKNAAGGAFRKDGGKDTRQTVTQAGKLILELFESFP